MIKRIIVFTIIIIMTILIASCSNYSKNYKYTIIKSKIESFVKDFDVNKNKSPKNEVELNEYSSEGGIVIGYYKGNNIKYIESIIYGEMGKTFYDIYFIDNTLTYFIKTDIKYDKPIYEDDFKIIEEKIKKYVILEEGLLEFNEMSETLNDVDKASIIIDAIEIFKESLKN